MHTHTHTCTRTHAHMHTHKCTYAHAHVHMPSHLRSRTVHVDQVLPAGHGLFFPLPSNHPGAATAINEPPWPAPSGTRFTLVFLERHWGFISKKSRFGLKAEAAPKSPSPLLHELKRAGSTDEVIALLRRCRNGGGDSARGESSLIFNARTQTGHLLLADGRAVYLGRFMNQEAALAASDLYRCCQCADDSVASARSELQQVQEWPSCRASGSNELKFRFHGNGVYLGRCNVPRPPQITFMAILVLMLRSCSCLCSCSVVSRQCPCHAHVHVHLHAHVHAAYRPPCVRVRTQKSRISQSTPSGTSGFAQETWIQP